MADTRLQMVALAVGEDPRAEVVGGDGLAGRADVVTLALDVDSANARPWIAAAAPAHPSLVDTAHVTDELFGFVNVPMAVWIDEQGVLVRPAEQAATSAWRARSGPMKLTVD